MPTKPSQSHKLIANTAQEAVLLLSPGPGGVLLLQEWAADGHDAVLLSEDPDTVAAAALPTPAAATAAHAAHGAHGHAAWLLLSSTYGLMEVASSGDGHASLGGTGGVGGTGAPAGPLTYEQQVQVQQLLDSVVNQAAAQAAAQQSLLALASSLRRRLEGLGALSTTGNMAIIATYSTGLVDTLPKQWTLGGGCVPAGMVLTVPLSSHDFAPCPWGRGDAGPDPDSVILWPYLPAQVCPPSAPPHPPPPPRWLPCWQRRSRATRCCCSVWPTQACWRRCLPQC